MLYGTYEHNIDGKYRIFVPAKIRAELGDEYVYKLFNAEYPSIQLFSREDFEAQALSRVPGGAMSVEGRRELAKYYMGVGEATCDAQGRIILSSVIAKSAGLTKECMIVGFGTYAEIMSAENYNKSLGIACEENIKEEESFKAQEDFVRKLRSEGAYVDLGNKKSTENEVL